MTGLHDVRITVAQLDALRDAAYAERFEEGQRERNDVLVTLLYDTGLPARTLVALDVDAVSDDRTELAVPGGLDADDRTEGAPATDGGAGGADGRRVVDLDPTGRLGTRRLLSTYLRGRDGADALLPSRKADRLTVRGVRYVVERLADEADVRPYAVEGRADPSAVTPVVVRRSGSRRDDRSGAVAGRAGPSNTPLTGGRPDDGPGRAERVLAGGVSALSHGVEESVLDDVADLFYVIDANARIRRWNERVPEVTGYDADALSGMHALELIDPDDRPSVGEAMASVFDGNVETRETALHTRGGERIPYEFNGTPITDADGTVVGLAGIGRDVSERVERERERRQQEAIVNAVGDGIYRLDEAGNVVMVNDIATEVTGYDRDELVGEHVSMLIDDDDVARSTEAIVELLGDDDRDVADLEFDVHTADGDAIPCHARIAAIESDGEFEGTVGVIRDISARKERVRELERQRDELETLNRVNAVIRRIDRALVRATTADAVKRTVCRELADIDQYRFAWIGDYDAGTKRVEPQAWAGVEDDYLDARPGIEFRDDGDVTAETVYRTGEIQVAQNVAEDDSLSAWRDAALERGYRSAVAIPLSYQEATYGVLCIYAPRPNAFEDRECRILDELGTTIAHAISAVQRREALETTAVTELDLRVRDPDAPLCALADRVDATLTLNGTISRDDGSVAAFVTADGASASDLLDAARGVADEAAVVSEDDDRVLVRVEVASLLPFDVTEHGGVVRDAVAEDGVTRTTVELPQSVATRTVVDALESTGVAFDLVAQRDRERSVKTGAEFHSELSDALTDRQDEVLKTAYLSGFFDRPRTSSGEEVAESLDIATQTFHEHVRAAERTLVETYFE